MEILEAVGDGLSSWWSWDVERAISRWFSPVVGLASVGVVI